MLIDMLSFVVDLCVEHHKKTDPMLIKDFTGFVSQCFSTVDVFLGYQTYKALFSLVPYLRNIRLFSLAMNAEKTTDSASVR